ncbi:carbamoyltransferase HypF [candidate division KSB1 bacterium]
MVRVAFEESEEISCLSIDVHGIVQGVGFRPFIYTLARKYDIKGNVFNNGGGVHIEAEGNKDRIAGFLDEIVRNAPPLAAIEQVISKKTAEKGYANFNIAESLGDVTASAPASPDIGICDDCIRELFDPEDRRYHYPFINCTNCGPRYTIIEKIPYDRINTTMDSFTMCPECAKEYADPRDRRFHAQPNACFECGPRISLVSRKGTPVECADPLWKTGELLKRGYIIAVKGIGGFHLVCDAENHNTVYTLRRRKKRDEKPFAVMAESADKVRMFARMSSAEEMLLTSKQRPVVLIRKAERNSLSPLIAPGSARFGVMLPYTPLHYLLFISGFTALVMTSGNMCDEPIAIHNNEALERLSDIADYFLMHDRKIHTRNDDSVNLVSSGKPHPVRRSRGFVPAPVMLKSAIPRVLACGADLKNTFCLSDSRRVFLSQHIGDVSDAGTFNNYKTAVNRMSGLLGIKPEIIACDMHPDYITTRYAHEWHKSCPAALNAGSSVIAVQHHHAHIASCMAEHQIDDEVIGIALDGNGFGCDGAVWGGEVMCARLNDFERAAHFDYVPLPGGDRAVKEPWRMALSYLYMTYGDKAGSLKIGMYKRIEHEKLDLVLKAIKSGLPMPYTSSCGRLFDAVAALLCIRHTISYEGQAAIELESCIPAKWTFADRNDMRYSYRISEQSESSIIELNYMIEEIVLDISGGTRREMVSYKFHNTLIGIFRDICEKLRKERGLSKVILSGGCFQNMYLLMNLTSLLKERGFTVFTHTQVPSNDGGIALGQAVVAGTISIKGSGQYVHSGAHEAYCVR